MSNDFLQISTIDALIYCLFKTLNILQICYLSKTKMYLHDRIGRCVLSNHLAAILIFGRIQMMVYRVNLNRLITENIHAFSKNT